MAREQAHPAIRHAGDEMNLAPDGNGILHRRIVEQRTLQDARRHALWRCHTIAEPLRTARETCRGIMCQHASLIEDIDLLTARGLIHIGRTHENREMLLANQLLQNGPKFTPRKRIHANGRLVKQQEIGRAHKRTSEAKLLLHAAGQLTREPPGEPLQPHHRQQVIEASRALRPRHAMQIRIEIHVLLHREILVKAELLWHVAEPILHRLCLLPHIIAHHRERSRRRCHEPCN